MHSCRCQQLPIVSIEQGRSLPPRTVNKKGKEKEDMCTVYRHTYLNNSLPGLVGELLVACATLPVVDHELSRT